MSQPRGRKSEAEPTTMVPVREYEYTQSEKFFSLYSNNIVLRMTPWDIQLTFGEIMSAVPEKLTIENLLRINLSPQTAKALAKTLIATVQQYESQIGEIRYGEAKIEQARE